MTTIRTLISVLIVAVVVVSAMGIAWWSRPPEHMASSAGGGRLILGVLIASGLAGLWRLWVPSDRSRTP